MSGIKPKIEVISSLILLFASIIVITATFGFLIHIWYGTIYKIRRSYDVSLCNQWWSISIYDNYRLHDL